MDSLKKKKEKLKDKRIGECIKREMGIVFPVKTTYSPTKMKKRNPLRQKTHTHIRTYTHTGQTLTQPSTT